METLENILENQDKKMTETNQLLENVLENGDTGNKKVVEAIEKLKPVMESAKSMQNFLDVIKGDKGDSIKGDKGDSGEKGEKGESIKGDNGNDGNDGKDGINGEVGKSGSDGLDGDNGNDGKNGVDGKDGKDGKDASIKEIIAILKKSKISFKDLKDIPDIYKGKLMGAGYLKEITDIEVLTEPTNGQALVYDSAKKQWKAGTVGSSAGTVENLSSQCNGSRTVFATTSNTGIIWLTLNGTMLVEGKEFTRDSATQITLTFAPDTGEELYLKYV